MHAFCVYFNYRMLFFRFAAILGWANWSKLVGNDIVDWVDRLNHLYTVAILVVFAIFVGSSQYVGEAIHCYVDQTLNAASVGYVKSYCWVSNTYFTPIDGTFPEKIEERQSLEIKYYQWIPLILVFMAFLFKVPCMLWRLLNCYSGLNLEKIISLAQATESVDGAKRDDTISQIAKYIDKWLESHRHFDWNCLVRLRQRISKIVCFLCSRRGGTYLTGLYLFVKLMYVINVICQFSLLNAFLGNYYSAYGIEVVYNLYSNQPMKPHPRFPRVVFCDYKILRLANQVHPHTVQCFLPINLFNEKVFIFLWFWLVFVFVTTFGNFLFWIWRILFSQNRRKYVWKYLKQYGEVTTSLHKKVCQKFADDYLRDDGIFVLRLIAKNSNHLLLGDLIQQLWFIFKNKPSFNKLIDENFEANRF